MKIKKLILTILSLLHQLVSAQQNCNLNYQDENRFKEIYDYLCTHRFSNSNPDEPEITALSYSANNYTYPNSSAEAEFQFDNIESLGNILESLIRMYEITHDKAYLIKAINKSIQLMNARGGASAPSPYAWASGWNNTGISTNGDTYIPYLPGAILHPMAHLCHLILVDEYSTLCSATLPLSPENLIPNLPTLSQNTYGQFADWLVHECVLSLDWCINTFWLSDTEGFREEHTGDFGGAINQQAPYAAALFYLGHLKDINPCFAYQGYYSGLQSYMDKASNLAYLYNGNINLYSPGTFFGNSCNPAEPYLCFTRPVFNYLTSSDSYWWYTTGWGFEKETISNPQYDCFEEERVNCNYYYDITPEEYTEDFEIKYRNYIHIEDISHGIRTLIYPRVLNKYNTTSGGNLMFDNTKMLRFRNVIKNVAWNQDINNPLFYTTVSGLGYDGNASSSSCPILPCPMDKFGWDVLNWMSFAEYELPNSDLYSILINKFKSILNSSQTGNIANFINGGKMNALAEFTDQTWKRECYDLTMYNRKLTYNQNFFAKHNLDVFPTADNCYHAANDESFADPIVSSNNFVIEPQVHAVFEADNRVTLKGEVHFKSGSEVTLRNTLGSCYTNGRTSNQAASNEGVSIEMPKPEQQHLTPINEPLIDKTTSTKNSIILTPNPANKQFTVSSNEPLTQIIIYSLTGQTMAQVQQLNNTKFEFNVSEIPNGVYFVSIETQAGKEIKKIVIAKE
jgi:hypothetical protein